MALEPDPTSWTMIIQQLRYVRWKDQSSAIVSFEEGIIELYLHLLVKVKVFRFINKLSHSTYLKILCQTPFSTRV